MASSMVDIEKKPMLPNQDLLDAVRQQVALEKQRVRRLLLELRKKRELDEAAGKASSVDGDDEALAPRAAPFHPDGKGDDANIDGGEQDAPPDGGDESADEDADDFDMFQIDDEAAGPQRKKRKLQDSQRHVDLRGEDHVDDPQGYYLPHIGECLDNRYRVLSGLAGKGVYSSVLRCMDTSEAPEREVAVKVVRSKDFTLAAGRRELDFLVTLNKHDPDDSQHVIRWLRSFNHRNHLCLVFESMRQSLRSVLKTAGKGISLALVQKYAWQLMSALQYLKTQGIIHADIKPDNILVNTEGTVVKVCDLGSAYEANEVEITDALVSRFYRAPEVILGMRWSYPIDMWAMCCTLYELATGHFLFDGKTNSEMLLQMMYLKGKVSNKMQKAGAYSERLFTKDGRILVSDNKEFAVSQRPRHTVQDLLTQNLAGSNAKPNTEDTGAPGDQTWRLKAKQMADFLEKGLLLDPSRRMTPEEALCHPFLTESMEDITASLLARPS